MGLTTEVNSGGGNTLYLTIKAGNIVQSAKEGQEKAVAREWEDKDGNKGVSYEILHRDLTGFITSMEVEKGKYGEELNLIIEKDGEKAKLTIKTDSRYFADFAKKIPNVDLTKEVSINAYDFTPEGKSRKITGVSLKQDDQGIKNAYWDGKKTAKGYPVMEEDNPDSDDWKLHFLKERKYLKNKLVAIKLPTLDTGVSTPQEPETQDVEGDDVPF